MKKIVPQKNLHEFFYQEIQSILAQEPDSIDPAASFYLVNLLSTIYQKNETQQSVINFFDEPLALLLARAHHSNDPEERFTLLKHLGDRALYISGFFGDSLGQSAVDLDYYMAMGGTAYRSLSSISKEKPRQKNLSELFQSLAAHFAQLVDIISQISEASGITKNEDLLRLYERWIHTKSSRLLQKLKDQGIDPLEQHKKILH
ncbi:MAG: hypothetical protein KDD52_00095 [Bdellovibrionales bacterium]|nr:hypothetical protein [Bdellovibrionales bacterium]